MDIEPLYLKGDPLRPDASLFAKSWLIRRTLTIEAVNIYAHLRARGYQPLDSFIASFGSKVTGRLETLTQAAAALETSNIYQRIYAAADSSLSEEERIAEWAARAEEMSGYTQIHAQSLRATLPQYQSPYLSETDHSAEDESAYQKAFNVQWRDEQWRKREEREWKSAAEENSASRVAATEAAMNLVESPWVDE